MGDTCEGTIGEVCSTPAPWQTDLGPVTWVIPVPNLHCRGGYHPMDGSVFDPDAAPLACEEPDHE